MIIKPGFTLKLLEPVKIKNNLVLGQYDIVTVIKVTNKEILVQDILDQQHWIPKTALVRILKTKPTTRIAAHASLTAAPISNAQAASYLTRGVITAQVIAANVLNTKDPLIAAQLAVASSLLSMANTQGMTTNSISKLQMLAKKIVAAT